MGELKLLFLFFEFGYIYRLSKHILFISLPHRVHGWTHQLLLLIGLIAHFLLKFELLFPQTKMASHDMRWVLHIMFFLLGQFIV
jgi:hypothetical protein